MPGNAKRQVLRNPDQLGLNAAVGLNATVTSNVIDVEGFSQLLLEVAVTQSAATTNDFYIEVSEDGSVFHRLQGTALAAGTMTLSSLTYSKAIAAGVNYAVNMPINYRKMRFVFSGTGAHATNDKVTVWVRLQE